MPAGFAQHPRSRRYGVGRTLAVALVVTLAAAGCSSITPAGNGQTTGSGGAAGAGGDSFGTPATASEVTDGGTLVMALSAEPDKLDPTLSRSLYSRYVFHAMCEKLYDVDSSAKIVPQLATALPRFRDVAEWHGRRVPLLKRAQLTAFDLGLGLRGLDFGLP